ncbi:Rib/alpha-like domain-containing protein [Rothia sp. BD8]|uniref:Rib/alpha-like domain-containing protein n=1 Tax=Rothia sp. BD8 TaxID=2953894 RepID=UPI00384F9C76
MHLKDAATWEHVSGFTFDRSELPQGWSIDVDMKTGAVRVTWPAEVPAGLTFTVPFTATFEDGSVHESAFQLGNPGADGDSTAQPSATEQPGHTDDADTTIGGTGDGSVSAPGSGGGFTVGGSGQADADQPGATADGGSTGSLASTGAAVAAPAAIGLAALAAGVILLARRRRTRQAD